MPLKHFTETVLLLVLAAVTIATGIAVSVLPPLPGGWLPWGVLFMVTLAYPVALYAFLRRNRAEYTFRVLHFLPALIVALWALLELASQRFPRAGGLLSGFLWGHAAVPVLIGLALLALFCVNVIRRRVPRLAGLALLTALFAGFVVLSQDRGWGTQLAAVIGRPAKPAGSSQSSGKNLAPSSVPAEEEWRQKLRDVEKKSSSSARVASAAGSSARAGVASASSIASVSASSAMASSVQPRSSASSRPAIVATNPPNRLPTSGFGAEAIATLFVAGYCGVLHRRASKLLKS